MTIIFFLDKLISHINRIIQCCPVSSPIPWGQIQQSRKSRCQMISYPLTQVGRLLVYLTVWDSTMSQYSKLYSHTLTYCFWLSITFIFYRKRWSLEDLLTCLFPLMKPGMSHALFWWHFIHPAFHPRMFNFHLRARA